jgi:hypothetical protein
VLDALSIRLLWLEQQQFESEARIIQRERRQAPRWRTARLRARLTNARAAHRRCKTMLEASRDGVRTAAALAERCEARRQGQTGVMPSGYAVAA